MKKTILLLSFATLLVFACKKETVTPTPVTTDSFGLIQQKIFDTKCSSSGCHGSSSDNSYKQHNLVLKGTDVYERIMNGAVKNADAIKETFIQIIRHDLFQICLDSVCIFDRAVHNSLINISPFQH